jgi:hypothetical protein
VFWYRSFTGPLEGLFAAFLLLVDALLREVTRGVRLVTLTVNCAVGDNGSD